MKSFFKPESVALIGATDRPGAFGCFAAQGLIDSRERLRFYFVNRRSHEIFGEKAYPSLDDLPERPELIMIATPAAVVNDLLRQAGELGIKAAIVFSSGFAEDHRCGGVELEQEMIRIARQYGMKIVGPNCVGIMNNVDKVKLWGSTGNLDFARPKGVAVLAQSGGYAIGGVTREYIGLSYAISSGNGNMVTIEELALYCVRDENVTAVAMYIEGVKKADVFYEMLAEAAKKHKPVIILKSGRSEKGAISAASHTGNLSGSAAVFGAVFEKFGVISVDTVEEFYGALQVVSILKGKLPPRNRFAIVNRSGGETTMSADLADRYGIALLDLSEETKSKLNGEILPSFATAKNPLDMTADLLGDTGRLQALFEILAADENIDAIIAGFDFETTAADVGYDMHAFMGNPLIEYRRRPDALSLFVVPQYESSRSPEWRMKLAAAGIPILPPGEIGYSVLGKLAKHIPYDPDRHLLEWAVPDGDKDHKPRIMSEYESKKELQRNGVLLSPCTVVRSEKDLAIACSDIGFPLVLKVNSKDILHKTEAGGVELNIRNEASAVKAYHSILERCRAFKPDARIDGVLVEQMAKPGDEMIVGIKNDPLLGPMLLVGMGGVFVEVFKDVALTPCPLSKEEALAQLRKLKAFCLLDGYRGAASRDLDALTDLMVKISDYAVKNKNTLKELDLNPVIVYPKGEGVCIVDALIM